LGVHTGEVVADSVETSGKVEYRLVGHTANLAARLESIAPVGSIAISDYTRQLCEGYFELRGLGPMTVKGISDSSTTQSFTFSTYRRIARKARVCARFAIAHGPREMAPFFADLSPLSDWSVPRR
jgi:hypothetical protein